MNSDWTVGVDRQYFLLVLIGDGDGDGAAAAARCTGRERERSREERMMGASGGHVEVRLDLRQLKTHVRRPPVDFCHLLPALFGEYFGDFSFWREDTSIHQPRYLHCMQRTLPHIF